MSLGQKRSWPLVCLTVLAGLRSRTWRRWLTHWQTWRLADLVGSIGQLDDLVPQVGLGWLVGWRLVHLSWADGSSSKDRLLRPWPQSEAHVGSGRREESALDAAPGVGMTQ